jgi:hypothetical protein
MRGDQDVGARGRGAGEIVEPGEEERMNPPEKIWLTEIEIERVENSNKAEIMFEYILAPVWHDAKTDPPKERGVPKRYWGKVDYEFMITYDPVWWHGSELGWRDDRRNQIKVMKYTALPKPPKEEK